MSFDLKLQLSATGQRDISLPTLPRCLLRSRLSSAAIEQNIFEPLPTRAIARPPRNKMSRVIICQLSRLGELTKIIDRMGNSNLNNGDRQQQQQRPFHKGASASLLPADFVCLSGTSRKEVYAHVSYKQMFPYANNDILKKEQFNKRIAPQNGTENEAMKNKFPGGRSSLLQHLIGDVGDDFSSIQGAPVSRLSSQN